LDRRNFPELIHIGEGVVIGWRCVLIAHNTQMMPPSVAPVQLGRKVFLGQGATIMPGVTIGDYAQVGTHSLVTKDVEPYTVVAGIPARFVRKLTPEEIALRDSPQYLG
jgi:acetyltransferase-like isoleucine patch superfamily enzyme